MKKMLVFVLIAGMSFMAFKSEAESWDFQFGYQNVFSPNALDYVVQQQNIERTSEGGNGVSYWNPINAGTEAILTQEFTFSGPTTEIFLNATIATYNFGGGAVGNGSLWASTDDVNWALLENAPTPSYPGYPYGTSSPYDADLPSSLLGADQIYIKAQLNTADADIFAQFSRTGDTGNPNASDIFDLDANYTTASVPDAMSTLSLLATVFLILVFVPKDRYQGRNVKQN
jgi:hypothetical protein